jgi:tetratricopeptide (TPR) repeat protein
MQEARLKPPESAPRFAWLALAGALIVAAGTAAWSNSFGGPFIFDDLGALRDNPTIRHFPAWENFAPPHPNSLSRRPIVNLAFAINRAISGPGVRGYHVGNLLVHLLAALTLFGVVRRTLLLPSLRERFGSAATGLATAVSLIWTIHPLLTDAVTYLTQRTELLMGLFLLLTLYCAIRGASGAHPRRWYTAAVAACALGMGSKEVMAVAPIIVLLYDRCFLSGSFHGALRCRLRLYLGLAATWAILLALLIAYPWGGGTGAGFGLPQAGPWEYARTQPGVILHYLRLSFWPRPLCLDYGWPIATSAAQIVPPALVIAALLAGSVWALRRTPVCQPARLTAGFCGAWFFLILAPSSSFVPIATEIAAERRMYLPLAAVVAVCVVAAWRLGSLSVRRAAESVRTRKLLGSVLAIPAILCVAGAFGRMTLERNADYRDAIFLWRDTVEKRPLNSRAQSNLGTCHLEAGRLDEAIAAFTRAIELAPDFLDARYNRGLAFSRSNRLAEADQDFSKAIELSPSYAKAYNSRAAVRLRAGRFNEALADINKGIALNPHDAEAYVTRGTIYAVARHYAEAIEDYDRAIGLSPDDAAAWFNRGTALSNFGRPDQALSDLDHAIALDPNYAEAYVNRANLRAAARRFDEAMPDYDRAITLKPDYADAWLNRGAACANAGRLKEALHDLDNAIALRPDYARAYLTRALAWYALKENARALSDLRAAERLGARPDPAFLRILTEPNRNSAP